MRPISASATAEITSLICAGASSARWSATTVECSRPAASRELALVLRPGDRAAEDERRAGLRGDQVDPDDHAEHLGSRREHGNVADVVVEHGQHHVRPRLVRRRPR